MRQVVCTRPGLSVTAGERGQAFVVGDVVDLDAVLVPAADDRPAVTFADALGAHVETHFEPHAGPGVQTSAQPGQAAAAAPLEE